MSPTTIIFQVQLALGYAPWLLAFAAYGWPKLKSMPPLEAQRAIAVLHSFRFFGLAFLVPGVVGPGLPEGFATPAAYGDFATGLLAMAALLTVKSPRLFFTLAAAFNLLGAADILFAYYHGVQYGLPEAAGALGATYAIPILYVPLLMITHVAALRLLVRTGPRAAGVVTGAPSRG